MNQRAFQERCMDYALKSDPQGQGEEYFLNAKGRMYDTYCIASRYLSEGDSVLSIGGGAGYIEAMLASEMGVDVAIADFPAAIEIHKQQYKHVGIEPLPCDFSGENPLPEDIRADMVLSCSVLEHIPQPARRQFGLLGDRLADSGHLVVTTPNFVRLRNVAKMLLNRSPLEDAEKLFSEVEYENEDVHRREYTLPELEASVEKTMMETVESGHLMNGGLHTPATIPFYPFEKLIPQFRPVLYIVTQSCDRTE